MPLSLRTVAADDWWSSSRTALIGVAADPNAEDVVEEDD